jgi:hypothetical protein
VILLHASLSATRSLILPSATRDTPATAIEALKVASDCGTATPKTVGSLTVSAGAGTHDGAHTVSSSLGAVVPLCLIPSVAVCHHGGWEDRMLGVKR